MRSAKKKNTSEALEAHREWARELQRGCDVLPKRQPDHKRLSQLRDGERPEKFRAKFHYEETPVTDEDLDAYLDDTDETSFHIDPWSDKVLVTTLLNRRSEAYNHPLAQADRRKEIDGLERRQWCDWSTLITIEEFEKGEYTGTWSPAAMLTSEKYAELQLPLDRKTIKGRLVHQGDKEWNCKRQNVIDSRRRLLQESGLTVKPMNATELRCVMALELALSLEGGYELSLRIGDQVSAYTSTKRNKNNPAEKRWILFRANQLEWLPEHVQERAAALFAISPRGILCQLTVYLYGDVAAGFFYESRRNSDFTSPAVGLVQRRDTSVFKWGRDATEDWLDTLDYSEKSLTKPTAVTKTSKPGAGVPGCSALGFVDDHILLGHPSATSVVSTRLMDVLEYPEGSFQECATRSLSDLTRQIAHFVGIDLVITAGSPLSRSIIVSQHTYGKLWVGRFQAALQKATGSKTRKLRRAKTPGHAASRMLAPPLPSESATMFANTARSFLSAAAYAAQVAPTGARTLEEERVARCVSVLVVLGLALIAILADVLLAPALILA